MSRRKTFNDFAIEAMQNPGVDQNDVATPTDTEVDDFEELGLATEGWKGGVANLLATFIPFVGFYIQPAVRANLKAKEKELEKLTTELRVMTLDAGKKAVAEGKMSSEDFNKLERIEIKEFFLGALIQFVPFYNIYRIYVDASDLEDTMVKIRKTKADIDAILKKAAADANKQDK